VTAQQVALAWHLHRSPNSLPIPGTRSMTHAANIVAARLSLSSDEVRRLTDLIPEGLGPQAVETCLFEEEHV
jgi:aryl-alcohol dehydrogenase-like predicted oxidoreductase